MRRRVRSSGARRPSWVSRLAPAAVGLALVGPVLALSLSATAGAVPVPWKNCGSARDAIDVQKLDASVWPPQAGKPLTLSYRFTLSEALTEGSFEHVTTTSPSGNSAASIPFHIPIAQLFSFGLRGHSAAPGRKLPLPVGPYGRNLTVNVPSSEPVGSTVGVDLTGYDGNGHEVVCMQLEIPFK